MPPTWATSNDYFSSFPHYLIECMRKTFPVRYSIPSYSIHDSLFIKNSWFSQNHYSQTTLHIPQKIPTDTSLNQGCFRHWQYNNQQSIFNLLQRSNLDSLSLSHSVKSNASSFWKFNSMDLKIPNPRNSLSETVERFGLWSNTHIFSEIFEFRWVESSVAELDDGDDNRNGNGVSATVVVGDRGLGGRLSLCDRRVLALHVSDWGFRRWSITRRR